MDKFLQISEKRLNVFIDATSAILESKTFNEAAKAMFDLCKDLIGATEGYIALRNLETGLNDVIYLSYSDVCSVDPDLPMPIRGLREVAYNSVDVVYDNDFEHSKWMEFIPEGHSPLINVMFSPLVYKGKAVGIIGLANKPTDFIDNDALIAKFFGIQAALALQHSKYKEDVKDLENLLPICSSCKSIRDDKGYWERVESYIEKHQDVTFTHGICPDCVKELYPEYADDINGSSKEETTLC